MTKDQFQGEAEKRIRKEEGLMHLKHEGMGCVGRGWEEGVKGGT